MTDKDRARVYAAENVVYEALAAGHTIRMLGTTLTLPIERKFGHLEHVEAYVEQALKLGWFADRYPKAAAVKVGVRQRDTGAKAHYERYPQPMIAINDPVYGKPGWAMREMVVIHELAHHVVACECGVVQGHGPEFRGVFAELTSVFIGPEAGWYLTVCFEEAGLPCALLP